MSDTDTSIHRRVAALRAGADPAMIARLDSGWVALGDPQVIRGYCLLLPDPVVPQLNALTGAARSQFLADMAYTGDVLARALGALRVNYAIFGNQDPALHAHVFPRRADEPRGLAAQHPWVYDWAAAPRLTEGADPALLGILREAFRTPR